MIILLSKSSCFYYEMEKHYEQKTTIYNKKTHAVSDTRFLLAANDFKIVVFSFSIGDKFLYNPTRHT